MDGEIHEGGTFDLWRKIAKQDPAFGHPDKFCMDPEDSNWVSATVNDAGWEDHPVYPEDMQAGSAVRKGRYRRYRYRKGFKLAAELDDKPSAAVPQSAQGSGACLAVRNVLGPTGRLYQESRCVTAPARKSA
jgi:hypothetical protein